MSVDNIRSTDPIQSDRNNVRTEPLGTYRQEKKKRIAQAALSSKDSKMPSDFSYTRSDYRADKKENIQQRRLQGQNASAFGDFMNSSIGSGLLQGASLVTDIGNQFIDRDLTKNPTGFDAQQNIGNALIKSGNPYAAIAGVAYKALSGVAEQFGGNVNTINKDQANEVGLSKWERFGNNVLGVIPGMGWATDKTIEGQKSHLIDEMSNAYADSVSDIDLANQLGGSKFLFGRSKIQDHIATANRNNQLLTDMNVTNTQRKKSDYALDLAQQNLNRYAGTNYMNMRMGRSGMKIQSLEEIRELLKNRVIEELDVQKFAEGGSLMPSGKLHKELNHINELGEQYEDLTRKGIPVVTLDENNEIQQVAEIEHSEIILSKEITDQLEAFWKNGSEEAMIAAGKLIANEILYNTQDENNVIWESEKQQKSS